VTESAGPTAALLRPFVPADGGDVLTAFDDPTMRRQGTVTTLEEARRWVTAMTARHDDRHVFAVDVCGVAVGAVGITAIDATNRTGWFWYWMGRAHRGLGLTSRASSTLAN